MSKKYFEHEELLSPPIKRAAYSDRTAWLMENVLYDGRLVTYYEGNERDDTGLRFRRKSDCIYYCPKCGFKIET